MAEALEIAIETDSQELAEMLIVATSADRSLVSKREGLDGIALTTIIVTLTPIIVGQVARLVRAHIESKRHVRLIKDGITIQGVSEETLLKILRQQP